MLKALTEANESSPVLLHTTDILKRDYNVDPAAAQAADRMMEIVLHTCMQVRSCGCFWRRAASMCPCLMQNDLYSK